MNNSNTQPFAALSAAPNEAIPKSNTKAYHLLLWLIDGKEYDRNKLILDPLLGESMRSALQDLRSDKLLNWLIHSSVCEHTGAKTIQLDPRHLSGDIEQDAEARRERRKQFKEVSAKEAKQGRIREPKAVREMSDAQAEYFKSLGNAANDEN
tara:strand:+ start:1774 stop:2229 length:456 start_codon:yes stop_codon:yes gene_type:complete